ADAETQCGPLIRTEEVDRVERWVDEAIAAGGTLVCGGSRLSDTLFSPTVIVDPPESAKVSQEEIFGPVICVYGYDDIDLAIEQANALPYAFQAAVFTDRLSIANHSIGSLAGSAVMVNDHTAFRVDWMPFAGLRRSGLGVGGIAYTMADMSFEKMAVWNWPEGGFRSDR
ncbi:aldehyde dehydrogenase family protein, partial [Alteriqipengyuania sp.]|uniref:aldehyde dehydrogenase family protein n=1 Tax=Alteriqipengyuania sp. TaxID=2800692 RepID=UPI0035112720